MPTLQEQWLAKKMAKEQQQQQVAPPRPAPPAPQRQVSSSGGAGFYPQPQYQQSPSDQQSQLFQRQTSSSSRSEVIIPVHVEGRADNAGAGARDNNNWGAFQDAPPSPRYTGAAFPSKAFQAVRLLTGEDPFFSSPNTFSPSSYNNGGFTG